MRIFNKDDWEMNMREKLKQTALFMMIWILSGATYAFFNERRCVIDGHIPMLFSNNVKMICEPQQKD
jgi:hypothetical protein